MTQLSFLFVYFVVLLAVRTCVWVYNTADGCVIHHINFWWWKNRQSPKHSILTEIPCGWLPKNSLFQMTVQYWYGVHLVWCVVQGKCCDVEMWYGGIVHSSRSWRSVDVCECFNYLQVLWITDQSQIVWQGVPSITHENFFFLLHRLISPQIHCYYYFYISLWS